jgi:hypothetical protein
MQIGGSWCLLLLTNSVLVPDEFPRHLPMNRWAAAAFSASCGCAVHETFSALFLKARRFVLAVLVLGLT